MQTCCTEGHEQEDATQCIEEALTMWLVLTLILHKVATSNHNDILVKDCPRWEKIKKGIGQQSN